jgi:hypothetical protein
MDHPVENNIIVRIIDESTFKRSPEVIDFVSPTLLYFRCQQGSD